MGTDFSAALVTSATNQKRFVVYREVVDGEEKNFKVNYSRSTDKMYVKIGNDYYTYDSNTGKKGEKTVVIPDDLIEIPDIDMAFRNPDAFLDAAAPWLAANPGVARQFALIKKMLIAEPEQRWTVGEVLRVLKSNSSAAEIDAMTTPPK